VGRSTRRVILICEECGERLVLGEPEEVWLSTRTRFECECGGGRLLDQPPGSTRASGALRETEIKPARANPPLHKHSGPLDGVVASYAYRTGAERESGHLCIGMRPAVYGFPRIPLLGFSVNRGPFPQNMSFGTCTSTASAGAVKRLRTGGGDTVPYLRPIHWIVLPSQPLITGNRIS
jgi:hypothetical protein